MVHINNLRTVKLSTLTAVISSILIITSALPALSHGGKTHGGTDFSNFQAVQKAVKLYDRLITEGKLPEDWETKLDGISVRTRQSDGGHEYIVQFNKQEGDPSRVYFFFDQKGDYSGSNFTGK